MQRPERAEEGWEPIDVAASGCPQEARAGNATIGRSRS
jgi:hypothetical protein